MWKTILLKDMKLLKCSLSESMRDVGIKIRRLTMSMYLLQSTTHFPHKSPTTKNTWQPDDQVSPLPPPHPTPPLHPTLPTEVFAFLERFWDLSGGKVEHLVHESIPERSLWILAFPGFHRATAIFPVYSSSNKGLICKMEILIYGMHGYGKNYMREWIALQYVIGHPRLVNKNTTIIIMFNLFN